jgi:hypothetical protein
MINYQNSVTADLTRAPFIIEVLEAKLGLGYIAKWIRELVAEITYLRGL